MEQMKALNRDEKARLVLGKHVVMKGRGQYEDIISIKWQPQTRWKYG